MSERIIYTRPDGGVSVVVPSPNFKGTMAELQAKLESRGDLVAADAPEIVPVADVPSDRTFRNSWKRGEQGKKLGVDMVKAKDHTHTLRRVKREKEFKPLDETINQNIGRDQTKIDAAEAQRQLIRNKYDNIQNDIDAATTPEALKAIITAEGLDE